METREKILTAAAAAFTRYGYRQTNMELVAAEAALSRQGVYRHFSSKDALFVAMAEDMHRRSLDMAASQAAKARAATGDVVDVLVAAVSGRTALHYAFLINTPHSRELTHEHTRQCVTLIDYYRQRFMELLTSIIEAARKSGDLALLDTIPSLEFASDITTVALGLINAQPPKSPEHFRDDLTRILNRLRRGACR